MIPIPWFNADDELHSHPKARQAGLEAMGLWVLAGTYCTKYLTDGLVPIYYVTAWPKGKALAEKLVTAGLWEPAPNGNYQFLSWEEYQRTKTKVLEEREKARIRKQKWRDEHPESHT